MFVEALVPHEDLRALLASALPLTIRLDDTGRSHSLALSELLEIALVPEKGIRLVCKGHLHWPLLGIDAPLTVNALRVLLIPELARLVPLPILLEELDALRTRAAWGKVRISEQALVFALCVHTTFDRRGDAVGGDLAPAASGEATPPTGTDRGLAVATRASPVAVTLATAALFGLAAGAAFFGLRSVASRW